MPTSRCRARSSSCSCLRSLASSAPSGSSRRSTLRAQHQCPRQRDPLLLPAGQLGGPPFREFAHAGQFQRFVDAPLGVIAGRLLVLEPKRDVVPHRHEREQCIGLEDGVDRTFVRRIARDVTAVELDATGIGLLEPGDHPQGGRLATAGSAQKRVELAGGDVEVDTGYRRDPVERLDQLFQPDRAALHPGRPVRAPPPPRRAATTCRRTE